MTTEDKELLLKDLCARLPYEVHLFTNSKHHIRLLTISNDTDYDEQFWINGLYDIDEVKPYLRPMSSMNGEELAEYKTLEKQCEILPTFAYISVSKCILFDWLNAHHFDYRGLIEKGLAIAVTEENNPYED